MAEAEAAVASIEVKEQGFKERLEMAEAQLEEAGAAPTPKPTIHPVGHVT